MADEEMGNQEDMITDESAFFGDSFMPNHNYKNKKLNEQFEQRK